MEQLFQVLIDASSSFSWWKWILGIIVAVPSFNSGTELFYIIK